MKTEVRYPKLRLLYSFSKGYRLSFIVALIATMMGLLFSFISPQIIRICVDSIVGNTKIDSGSGFDYAVRFLGGRDYLRGHLYLLGITIAFFSALSGIFVFLRVYLVSATAEGVTKKIRDSLFAHIQELPFAYHTQNQTGDLVQRCTSDVETLRTFIEKQLADVFRIVVLALFSAVIMMTLNIKLAFVSLAFLPFILLYSLFFHRYIGKHYLAGDEAEGLLTAIVQENLSGVRVVRAFGREKDEFEKFNAQNQKFANIWVGIMSKLSLFWSSADFIIALQILSVIVSGAFLATANELTLGTFIAFASYNAMLAWPIRGLGRILADMSKANVSFGRIKEILDTKAEDDGEDVLTPSLDRDIEFTNVRFGYSEDSNILDGVSFRVKAGETVAFLGATGSGKSTIVHILCRFFDVKDGCGQVTIGGVDIKNIDRKYLRGNIGIVLQEPFLYSKTIRENIAITSPKADFARVKEAAEAASVDHNITNFNDGYNTIVGERGVTLSGGQKQRISIARILMRKNKILIFDDSLSAVDTSTENEIREALKEKSADVTTILISHRITTLMQADRIVVIHDGKVVENGSHQQLLQLDGIYKRIYDLQKSKGIDDGGDNHV